jgi:membrane-associated HD superfamily phosphohydrolase
MKALSYEEYKTIHKKLTKTQRAYYEKYFGYGTRVREENEKKELKEFEKSIAETVKKLRENINPNKVKK